MFPISYFKKTHFLNKDEFMCTPNVAMDLTTYFKETYYWI